MFTQSFNVELEWKRCCICGGYYAIENNRTPLSTCPYCAVREKRKLAEKIDSLGRSNISLRGALTAAKRKHQP